MVWPSSEVEVEIALKGSFQCREPTPFKSSSLSRTNLLQGFKMSNQHEGRGVTVEEFQKIKNERILELKDHTEARRQHDLQRIRDMKSSNGIHPLDRFPKEIWENVFQFLRPSDLGSILEVHDLFQQQLSKKRICDILLPQVLNLKSPEDENHYNGENCDIWMEEMPLEELSMKKLIRLRKVCKSLRNNIDHLFETLIMNKLFSKNENRVETFRLTSSGGKEDRRKLDRTLENFGVGSNKATRFFLRSLEIDLFGFGINNEKLMQFKSKVSNFLEMVGDQIWRFEYQISLLEGTGGALSSEVYIALLEWAELMPNLKWLVLDNQYETKSIPNLPPFPRLDHLVRICWRFKHTYHNHTFQMFSAILKANPHIKVLNVNTDVYDRRVMDTFFRNYFNPLLASIPSLALEACFLNSDRFDSGSECNFASMQPSINPNWPLKSLHLGCDLFNSKLKSVFELVQNFQTLEQLVLGKLIDPRFVRDIPFLNLPNLTYLKVEVNYVVPRFGKHVMEQVTPATNFFFSLQFLVHAKKLKKFVWTLAGSRNQILKLKGFLVNRECNEQCVNFRAGLRDIRSSNLWALFPCLEMVTVTTDIRNAHGDSCSYDVNEYHRSEKF